MPNLIGHLIVKLFEDINYEIPTFVGMTNNQVNTIQVYKQKI